MHKKPDRKCLVLLVSPNQVHSQQSFLWIHRLLGPHRFISDTHPVFISPHLSPPKPSGSAQHNCMGMLSLRDRNVRALHRKNHKGLAFYVSLIHPQENSKNYKKI